MTSFFGVPFHPKTNPLFKMDESNLSIISGSIGVNTTTPLRDSLFVSSSNSDVNGELFVANNNRRCWMSLQSGRTTDCNPAFVYPSTKDLRFGTWTSMNSSGLTETLRMTSTGYIGIGTSNPTELLELAGGYLYLNGENNGLIIDSEDAKRSGFIKYENRDTGLWRALDQSFEIGCVDVTNLTDTPSTWTTDLFISSNGLFTIGNSNVSGGKLDIYDTTGNMINLYEYNESNGAIIVGRRARGTINAPEAVGSNDVLAGIRVDGHDGTAWSCNCTSSIEFVALEDFTNTAKGTGIIFKTTAVGTSNPNNNFCFDGNGNVGIGTIAPWKALHTIGTIYATDTYLASYGSVDSPTYSFSNDYGTGMWRPSANTIAFSTNGNEKVRITDAGGSETALSVSGSIQTSNSVIASPGNSMSPSYTFSNDTDTGIWSPSSDVIAMSIAGFERMRLTSSGLQIQGKIFAANMSDDMYAAPSGSAEAPTYAFSNDMDTGVYNPGSNVLAISTNSTERIRVDENGRVGINNSNPQYTLDVDGDINATTLKIGDIIPTTSNINIGINNNDTIINIGTTSNIVNIGGTLYIAGFGTVSDVKFKTNIQELSGPTMLDNVSKLLPVEYIWNDTMINESYRGQKDIGLIAQEVEKIIPEAVKTVPYKNDTFKTIKYERLIPVLVGAIKELQKEIVELKNKHI